MIIMAGSAIIENSVRSIDANCESMQETHQATERQSRSNSGGDSWQATAGGLLLLVILWAYKLYTTWGACGAQRSIRATKCTFRSSWRKAKTVSR